MLLSSLTAMLVLVLMVATYHVHLVLQPRIDDVASADAIYVIGPATDSRIERAEQLLQQGVADSLVVSATAERAKEIALCADPKQYDVVCEQPTPFTTLGEAVFIDYVAESRGWTSVIVITQEAHVERARGYFDRCYSGESRVVSDGAHASLGETLWHLIYQGAGYFKYYFITNGCVG